MMRFFWWLPACLAILSLSGCQAGRNWFNRPATNRPAGVAAPALPGATLPGTPPGQALVPPVPTPVPGSTSVPPPPEPSPVYPVPGVVSPPAGQPPSPVFPGIGNVPPSTSQKMEYRWAPAPGSVRLAPPEPLAPEASSDKTQLYPPQTPEPPVQTPEKKPSPVPALPVGIPQFTLVKDQLANGLRPSLDEGLDWLKENGYKTVLFLRQAGEEDSADRKQVEKRGLKFLALEVSPKTLSRKILDDFKTVVQDTANYPLFVYDRDGSLAGGLWYLHFRLAELVPDDTARVRAGSLGFREDRDDSHRVMWLAVQKLLSDSLP